MALDQSALLELLELLEVMRSANDGELMHRLLGTIMQALVDAEATAHIGAVEIPDSERSHARARSKRRVFKLQASPDRLRDRHAGGTAPWAAAGSVDTDLSFLSFLELYRTDVPARRMAARRVAEALDVVEHV